MAFKTEETRTVTVTCTSECDRCGFTVVESFESSESKRSSDSPKKNWSNIQVTLKLEKGGHLTMITLCCPKCTATELKLLSYWRVYMPVEIEHKETIKEQDIAIETHIARFGGETPPSDSKKEQDDYSLPSDKFSSIP